MSTAMRDPGVSDSRGRVRMLPGRLLIVLVGVVAGLYGGYLMLQSQQGEALRSAVVWLVGGVIVHDALIAAVALLVGLVVTRVVPRVGRGPLVVGLVVLGTISVIAIPFLGRFGALPYNPTLLPRNYTVGYLVILALVVVGVAVGVVLRARRSRPPRADRRSAAGGDDDGATPAEVSAR